MEGRTFKLLPGLVNPAILHGSTIKDEDGSLLKLHVEELQAGWDASNSITHTFDQSLCEKLDELVTAQSSIAQLGEACVGVLQHDHCYMQSGHMTRLWLAHRWR